MKRLNLLIAFLCCFTVTVFSQTELNTIEEEDFKIQYSNDWHLSESGLMGTKFVLFTSLSSEKDKFRDNINFIIQDLTEYSELLAGVDMDLGLVAESTIMQIKLMMSNVKVISNERVSKNGLEYQRLIYKGKQGKLKLIFEQRFCLVNDKMYLLTFTSEKKEYKEVKQLGEKVLDSFEIKETNE